MTQKQVKATFFLPLKDNDGSDLSAEIAEVEDRCFEAFGAWTAAGYYKGVWRMETGERVLDTSAVYMVVIPEKSVGELETMISSRRQASSPGDSRLSYPRASMPL